MNPLPLPAPDERPKKIHSRLRLRDEMGTVLCYKKSLGGLT